MRTVRHTSRFKRDYKRISKGTYRTTIDALLQAVVVPLASDQALDSKYRDHSLGGDRKDHRDCHVKPDLVLIYRKFDRDTPELVRLGTHSELSL